MDAGPGLVVPGTQPCAVLRLTRRIAPRIDNSPTVPTCDDDRSVMSAYRTGAEVDAAAGARLRPVHERAMLPPARISNGAGDR